MEGRDDTKAASDDLEEKEKEEEKEEEMDEEEEKEEKEEEEKEEEEEEWEEEEEEYTVETFDGSFSIALPWKRDGSLKGQYYRKERASEEFWQWIKGSVMESRLNSHRVVEEFLYHYSSYML